MNYNQNTPYSIMKGKYVCPLPLIIYKAGSSNSILVQTLFMFGCQAGAIEQTDYSREAKMRNGYLFAA